MADEQVQEAGEQIQAPVESQESAVSSAPESQPATPEAAPVEKMVPSSQVSKIAAREARDAVAKAEARWRAQQEAQYEAPQQSTANPTLGGIPQVSDADFERRVFQAAQRISVQSQAERIETEFLSKIDAERHSDPEFADLYDALNIEANPNLVIWANSLDNTGAVVKELAKYPGKYATILNLMNSGSPKLAQRELQSLSSSIKANIEATKQPSVAPPLSQMKPSNIGADNGDMSVGDYMKHSWLRG